MSAQSKRYTVFYAEMEHTDADPHRRDLASEMKELAHTGVRVYGEALENLKQPIQKAKKRARDLEIVPGFEPDAEPELPVEGGSIKRCVPVA